MRTQTVAKFPGQRMERRRYTRFDTSAGGSRLAVIGRSGASLEMRECSLRNISYGGMCFHGSLPLHAGDVADFLIDLKTPLEDLVLVRARIEWEGTVGPNGRLYGARFLDSSKGWLAGVDDTIH
jgi:PilZ domain